MFWSFLQALGSLVGLITGVFVVFEYFTRHRPLMFIIAVPFADVPGANRFYFLRVKNRAERPLLLRVRNGSRNGELRLSKDDSTHAFVTSVLEGSSTFVIDGSTHDDFPLSKPPNFDELDSECYMRSVVYWKFAQPPLWLGWRKQTLRISKQSFQSLGEEEGVEDHE